MQLIAYIKSLGRGETPPRVEESVAGAPETKKEARSSAVPIHARRHLTRRHASAKRQAARTRTP